MEIVTRYRDITLAEVRKVHHMIHIEINNWHQLRGKPVTIKLPPHDNEHCGGPWYEVVNGPIMPAFVCPHIAEIGD